jgi:hypothetical protein
MVMLQPQRLSDVTRSQSSAIQAPDFGSYCFRISGTVLLTPVERRQGVHQLASNGAAAHAAALSIKYACTDPRPIALLHTRTEDHQVVGDRIDDLRAEVTALSLLIGLLVARDPHRDELMRAYRQSLELLEHRDEWTDIADRVKEYGELLLTSFQPGDMPKPS